MRTTATRDIQKAISAAKQQTHRPVEAAASRELLTKQLEQCMERAREAQEQAAAEFERTLARDLERFTAHMLIFARLTDKLHEAPSGLDEKLRRLVRSMNRSLR